MQPDDGQVLTSVGLPTVAGERTIRLLLGPTSTTPWAWSASPRLGMNRVRLTPAGTLTARRLVAAVLPLM
jgi:hypothetical protein